MNLHSFSVQCEHKYHRYFTDGDREVEERRSSPSQSGLTLGYLEPQTNAIAHAEILLLDSFSKTFKSNMPQPASPRFPLLKHLVKVFRKQLDDMPV